MQTSKNPNVEKLGVENPNVEGPAVEKPVMDNPDVVKPAAKHPILKGIGAAIVIVAMIALGISAGTFAFAAGKATLRVTGADLLNEQTYGPSKTLVESNSPIAAAPTLELVASDGTPFTDDKGIWRVFLTDGGRKLKFGPVIGTRILVK